MPVNAQILGRKAKGKSHQLRKVQDGHAELLAHILLDLTLEAVKNGVAKRARRYHAVGAIHLGCLNMCAGELDRDALVVGSGVETAALGSAAVVDGSTAENFGQPFERNAVARIYKLVALRRARDVTAVECRNGQAGKRPLHQRAQACFTDILVQHPKEVADPRVAAITQTFICKLLDRNPLRKPRGHPAR